MRDHHASPPGAWRRLARRWLMLESLVDVGGAPVARRSVRLCCDAARLVAPADRTKRRWLDALRDLAAAAGRGATRRWMHARWRGDAHYRAPPCALAAHVISDGGRRPVAAPASLRRCRNGWSEFF
ncbi:hypothetical protein F511_29120 [Dorcoceras hygrometricum]|uniref:Uncharacterized protein n=1 Tax=Dorcoceras hygrometricum TaxID=472368 RepID=A0A2Z7A4G8_9LAMI|nr:hypothetical protein F511_29120 [Dorcoceras hygrometricum]